MQGLCCTLFPIFIASGSMKVTGVPASERSKIILYEPRQGFDFISAISFDDLSTKRC